MKRLIARIALTLTGFTGILNAQQDAQFTQFMFNKLVYNPGYAGTSGSYCGTLQFRQQWTGFTGAPQTFAFSGDMRLPGLPIGVGINVINDKIGPMNTFFLRFAGAYNAKIGDGYLGAGIDLGLQQKSINNQWVAPEPGKIDNSIPTTAAFGKTSYDVGAGVFYQMPKLFYVGISTTHLPSQTLTTNKVNFKVTRHYYFMAGATIDVLPNDWLKVCPNIMFKSDAAGSAFDANLNLLVFDMAWAGFSLRPNDAAALLLGYQFKTGHDNSIKGKIGYSYDFTTTALKTYNSGSHEIILGVCYTPKVKKITRFANDRFLD